MNRSLQSEGEAICCVELDFILSFNSPSLASPEWHRHLVSPNFWVVSHFYDTFLVFVGVDYKTLLDFLWHACMHQRER